MELVTSSESIGANAKLDQLIEQHYSGIYAFAYRMLGNATDAKDVTQETFARCMAKLDTFRTEKSFPAWILSIAANHIRDRFRKKKAGPLTAADEAGLSVELPPDAKLIREEDRDCVLHAITALSFDLRVVVVLVFTEDRPHSEVAEALGTSVNAVRIRLYRALGLLREAIKEKK